MIFNVGKRETKEEEEEATRFVLNTIARLSFGERELHNDTEFVFHRNTIFELFYEQNILRE